MPTPLDSLVADPDFHAASDEARGIAFDRIAPTDPDFLAASPEAQAEFKTRLLTAPRPGTFGASPEFKAAAGANLYEPPSLLKAAMTPISELAGGPSVSELVAREAQQNPDAGLPVKAMRGLAQTVGGALDFAQSPAGVATLPLLGVGGIAGRVIGGGAAVLGAKQAVEGGKEIVQGVQERDVQKVVRGASGAALGATMATAGGAKAVRPGVTAPLAERPPAEALARAAGAEEMVGVPSAEPPPRPTLVPPLEQPPEAPVAEALPKPPIEPVSPPPPEVARPIAPPQAVATPPLEPSPELQAPQLKEPIHRKVAQAAEEIFARGATNEVGPLGPEAQRLDPKRPVSDQIVDLLHQERVPLPEVQQILAKHGLDFTTFADQMFRPAVTDAARRLQALSILKRRINMLADQPGNAEEIGRIADLGAEIDASIPASSWWRRADNIRRGLLVTQLATAARNYTSQLGRVALDGLDVALQRTFQGTRAVATENKIGPLDGFESFVNIFKRGTKAQVDQVLNAMPQFRDRLLGSYSSDISKAAAKGGVVLRGADRVFAGAEKTLGILNWANQLQEFTVRRGVFITKLAQRAQARGLDLPELIKSNRLGELPEGDFAAATQKALEITFAENPKFGTLASDAVKFARNPVISLVAPFPRFMFNSLKFLWDFSPGGFLRLLSSQERAAIAAGNTATLSRATLGTALLGAAYQLRGSQYAGEKWNEVTVDGKTYDMRPYNPLAAYLFVGDVLHRMKTNTLERISAKDLSDAVLSVNVKGGAGLQVVDQMIQGLGELSKPGRWAKAGKQFAGAIVGGLATPIQTVYDVMAQFDDKLRTMRDARDEPLLGPAKQKIPGLAQTLPERQSPTREATPEKQSPLLRQATGLTQVEPKNAAEKELDRLQFQPQEILPSTGEPAADRLIAKHMGPIIEQMGPRLFDLPGYQKAGDQMKALFLQQLLAEARKEAVKAANKEDPALMAKVKLERLPSRLGSALEEIHPGLVHSITGQ